MAGEIDANVMREQARRFDGLYAGQCEPDEYKHLIEAGFLSKSYDHAGGILGLAKLRATRPGANHD